MCRNERKLNMKKEELNITWLYPDVLNLHGDRGNVMALKKVGEMLNWFW